MEETLTGKQANWQFHNQWTTSSCIRNLFRLWQHHVKPVPQRSVLRLFLFLAYISGLPESLISLAGWHCSVQGCLLLPGPGSVTVKPPLTRRMGAELRPRKMYQAFFLSLEGRRYSTFTTNCTDECLPLWSSQSISAPYPQGSQLSQLHWFHHRQGQQDPQFP